jgi:ethanolamine utilization cobalamin adenosyltransferase
MTPAREAHLIGQLRTVTTTEELNAFRAQIRAQGETVTSDLFRAMERTADTLRGRT